MNKFLNKFSGYEKGPEPSLFGLFPGSFALKLLTRIELVTSTLPTIDQPIPVDILSCHFVPRFKVLCVLMDSYRSLKMPGFLRIVRQMLGKLVGPLLAFHQLIK